MVSKRPATTWLINEIENEFRNKNYYLVLQDLGNVGDQGRDLVSDQALRNQLASHLAMNNNVFTLTRNQVDVQRDTSAGSFDDSKPMINRYPALHQGSTHVINQSRKGGRSCQSSPKRNEEVAIGARGGRRLILPKPPDDQGRAAHQIIDWLQSQAAPTDIAMQSRLDVLKSAGFRDENSGDAAAVSAKVKNILRESTAMDGSFRITVLYLIKRGDDNVPELVADPVNDGRRRKVARKLFEQVQGSTPQTLATNTLNSIDNWDMMGVLANSRQLINETELRCVSSRIRGLDPAEQQRIEMLFGLYLLHQAVFMPHIEVLGSNGQTAGTVKGLRYASYLMTDLLVFPVHVSWLFHRMKTPTHWTTRDSLNYVHSNSGCRCRVPFKRQKGETKAKTETESIKISSKHDGGFANRLEAIYGGTSKIRSDGNVASRNYQHSAASISKHIITLLQTSLFTTSR